MIAILDFGMGNLHSLIKAVSLFSKESFVTENPKDLETATKIILPGDGHFRKAMENLQNLGLIEPIHKKLQAGIPLFGICIGFQILFENSEEGGSLTKGLSLIPGVVRKFKSKSGRKIPHMGWNLAHPTNQNSLIDKDHYFYFIHSYRPEDVPPEFVSSTTDYDGDIFPSFVQRNNIYGSQFHPEKSEKQGLELLKSFIMK